MALYLSIAILTACVLALILRPFITPPRVVEGEDDSHLHVYKQQLETLAGERASGRISSAEAEAMEAEIRRNLLAAARFHEGSETASGRLKTKPLAAAIGLFLILSAVGLYSYLGAPNLPDQPLSARDTTAPTAPPPQMAAAIAELEERLKSEGDSAEGWYVLGRAKMTAGEPVEAVNAFRQALRLAPDAWQIKGDLAAALTRASNGLVGPEAEQLFEEVLAIEPREPRARYFLGIAKAQSGALADALAIWRALEAESTPDAPWMPALKASIQSAAQDLGVDPESITPQQVSNDQDAMIRAMVEGLAAKMEANPDNQEGWLRLAKSYSVLGEMDKAKAALARAKAVDADAPALRQMAAELGISLESISTP